MAKECVADGCKNPRFGGGYCKWHQRLRTDKKPKRIAVFSKKREEINVEYSKKSREYREANPACRVNSPVCTRLTQGVHHLKGKSTIELLMDDRYWKPACNACNGYVEDHSEWAIATGNKLSKHN